MLLDLLWVLHVIICVVLIVVVLLQAGKGASAGFSFGGGASQTVFGSSGGKNFFARVTAGLAIGFMVTSITLSVMSSKSVKNYRGVMQQLPTENNQAVPEKLPDQSTQSNPGSAADNAAGQTDTANPQK